MDLPEIVHIIVDHVQQEKNPRWRNRYLYSCMLVNRLWFWESASTLWKRVRTNELAMVPNRERRNVYSNFIKDIEISSKDGPYIRNSNMGLEFKQLERVCSDRFMLDKDDTIRPADAIPYITPSLRYFSLKTLYYSENNNTPDELWDVLIRNCRNLTRFEALLPSDNDPGCARFIRECSSLQELVISGLEKNVEDEYDEYYERWVNYTRNEDVIRAIVTHPNLVSLVSHFDSDVLIKVLDTVEDPFPKLKSLRMPYKLQTGRDLDLLPYLNRAAGLQELSIKVEDSLSGVDYGSVIAGACPKLVKLKMRGGITSDGLVELAKRCTQLRTLEVCHLAMGMSPSERTIELFAQAAAQLRHLTLEFYSQQCALTFSDICMLGRYCRKLVTLEVKMSKQDDILSDWEFLQERGDEEVGYLFSSQSMRLKLMCDPTSVDPKEPVLFPKLRVLYPRLLCRNNRTMDRFVKKHFPKTRSRDVAGRLSRSDCSTAMGQRAGNRYWINAQAEVF